MLHTWFLVLEPYQAEWQMDLSQRPALKRRMELLAVSHQANMECACPWTSHFRLDLLALWVK